jgi:AGZA family xanthine/uracil permease-like MFS transporter
MSSAASIQPRRAYLSGPGGQLWTRGDLNAFFGLGINMLVNVLVIAGLTAGVVHLSHHDTFRVILPALGVELLLGNIFYFMLARRLARKEGRDTVTALPYGPSVPHMFIVSLVIMLPIYLRTHDPIKAWEGGIAWAFIIGVIILIGAFVGPTIRRFTPRAALLGTLAGISITFISMRPAAQMWGALWIALPAFFVIVIGFVSGVRLPRNFPVGLAALLLGSAIAWIGGYMNTADVSNSVHEIALGLPSLNINHLINGLNGISPLLATAIPLGIYNFTEAMSNVESAAAAGDSYNLRHVLLADGTGAVIGSALGSPFPPAVYIGHPGWKAAGGRITYSLATGVGIFLFCTIGLFPLLAAVLPIPAIVPILLYIGLVIGAQAFASVPRAHFAAIVLAIIPNVAQWASGLVDSTLSAAGTSAAKVGLANLENAGVIYGGLVSLGQGAILAGMVLGAIGALIIDRRFEMAAGYSFFGAGLAFVGLIHGPKVGWAISPKVALGYAMAGVVCLAFARLQVPRRVPDLGDPIDAADAAAAAAVSSPSTEGHADGRVGVPGAEPVPA